MSVGTGMIVVAVGFLAAFLLFESTTIVGLLEKVGDVTYDVDT